MAHQDDFEAKILRVSEFMERNGMLPQEHQLYRGCESKEGGNMRIDISVGNFYTECKFKFYQFVSTCSLFVLEPERMCIPTEEVTHLN